MTLVPLNSVCIFTHLRACLEYVLYITVCRRWPLINATLYSPGLAAPVRARPLLLLLRLPRRLHRVPDIFRKADELVELSLPAEALPAVDRDALAVHVLRP